jgi:UDP-N-acetylmuramate--alanine ligase
VHVVGIGGSAMSAIATILAAMGHRVTGSDLDGSATVDRLRSEGIDVTVGPHAAASLPADVDVVARSSAITDDNPEVLEARRRGVPVESRAEALAAICGERRTVAVSGTHGKTTTTAMLVAATDATSYLVGGDLVGRGSGVRWTDGSGWFVVEADESDRTFVALPASVVVATNVEADHLDTYGTLDGIVAAFDQYVGAAPAGGRIVCADEPNALALARRHGATTYGTHADADWRIVDPVPSQLAISFRLSVGGADRGVVQVPAPGLHNARNAVAALAAAEAMGVDFEAAREGLAGYAGVARRFEVRGSAGGVTVVDDYAHNPGKVAALLASARASGGWRRIVVVFQPHRYTRTAALARQFGPAFGDADAVVITEIYAANEPPLPGVTGKLLVDATLEAHPWKRVAWLPAQADVLRWLAAELRPGDLCLTAGAGDVTTWPDAILAAMDAR